MSEAVEIKDWMAWGKQVRQRQMASTARAWAKLGKKPKFKLGEERKASQKPRESKPDPVAAAVRKATRKISPARPVEPEEKPLRTAAKPKPQKKVDNPRKEAGVSRGGGIENTKGFACPVCWGVPKNIRNDGVSVARHLPVNPDVRRYRDTEFCDGQGKIAIAVMSVGWEPGEEPRQKMSAKKWLQGRQEDRV